MQLSKSVIFIIQNMVMLESLADVQAVILKWTKTLALKV